MSNNRKSRTVYAILGFLCSKPRSGYDIKKAIEKSVGFFWSESYGQIYPILKKLVEDGLAEKLQDELPSSRKRQRYAITDKGRKQLAHWIEQDADYRGFRNELLLKLFFGTTVDTEVSIRHLRDFIVHEKKRLEMFEGFHATLPGNKEQMTPNIVFLTATLNYGLSGTQHNIKWAEETIGMLEELDKQ
ncbi:PadR family transcriptional regulator [Emcibacter sp.]|uniref:PadR family transcriptional regulator n=1 Tax=Emcibacter sp. TaxID=1979954 RepID=UPI002AA5EF0B|nr:PadR family transcriptional regulator [Emcibacter sp.]